MSQEFRDAVGFMQNIVLLSSADMFAASFVATQGCVGALLAVLLVQALVKHDVLAHGATTGLSVPGLRVARARRVSYAFH